MRIQLDGKRATKTKQLLQHNSRTWEAEAKIPIGSESQTSRAQTNSKIELATGCTQIIIEGVTRKRFCCPHHRCCYRAWEKRRRRRAYWSLLLAVKPFLGTSHHYHHLGPSGAPPLHCAHRSKTFASPLERLSALEGHWRLQWDN